MTRIAFTASLVLTMFFAQFALGQEAQEETLAQRHDRLKIAVQEICPMTGNKLGEHGDPVKVRIGQEVIFVCCEACLEREVNREHWATIHANFARAQAICPVMEKELPAQPKWTIVEGQIVYVCCPPCVDKIQEESAKYLAAVDSAYEKYLEEHR